jgi:hypothetical protein
MVEQYYLQCPRCGANREEGSKYCHTCGTPLLNAPSNPAYAPVTPRRRKSACFMITCAVLLVVLATFIGFLASFLREMGFGRAKTVFGKPLAWQYLKWTHNPSQPASWLLTWDPFYSADLAIGDFDGDKDDELYVSNCDEANLFELDGKGRLVAGQRVYGQGELGAWDYNRDGKDELLSFGYASPDTQVYDLQGNLLSQFQELPPSNGVITGDFDGDGAKDLVLADESTGDYYVYAPGGKQIWHMQVPITSYKPAFGDVDGDKRFEMIVFDGSELHISGIGKNDKHGPNWQGSEQPVSVLDVDHDGRGEVFMSDYAYLTVATGKATTLHYGRHSDRTSMDPTTRVLLAHLPVASSPCLAMIGVVEFGAQGELYLLDTSGKCIYEERYGNPFAFLSEAHASKGRDFLVVKTEHKIKIYP